MIVTKIKPQSEIFSLLLGVQRVFLLGCGDCATVCKTGSEEVLIQWSQYLRNQGIEISGHGVAEVGCNAASVRKTFAQNSQALKKADAILVFSCGLGVQSVRQNLREEKRAIPALNTIFAGVTTTQQILEKRCLLCGECVLGLTAGICPKALCSKGLLNGPCGGTKHGKCEVDKNKECAWAEIHKHLAGKPSLKDILAPQDHSRSQSQNSVQLV